MNRTKLTLISSIALAAVAMPFAANAQSSARAAAGAHVSAMHTQARMSTAPAGARFAGRGNHWRDGNHRWPRYRGYYYSGFGYPYYGFGDPFGPFGYGSSYFGYPYFAGYYDSDDYGRRGSYQSSGGSVVAQVQQQLAREGFYRGAVDGVNGNGTRNAIRAFQRRNGLPVSGRIDNELLDRLGVS